MKTYIVFGLLFAVAFAWGKTAFVGERQPTTNDPVRTVSERVNQANSARPYASEAPVAPLNALSAPAQHLVRTIAKEYGVSEEEARQVLRKGSSRGYSQDEVNRVFGK